MKVGFYRVRKGFLESGKRFSANCENYQSKNCSRQRGNAELGFLQSRD